MLLKIAIPDLISNSYFPALAAVELGYLKDEGFDGEVQMVFPVDKAYRTMRDGDVHVVAGSAHSVLSAFPEWQGAKLLCAQAQGMYWFLVMRADLNVARNDISGIKGRRIGAAPWVEMGLRRLLTAAGIDAAKDNVTIAPIPAAAGAGVNFGVSAAKALEDGVIDGFWANGMGAEVAVRRGVGNVVLDIRRGDGPAGCFDYTMASVAATDQFISQQPEAAAAMVRAIVKTQNALRNDPEKAFAVSQKLFPASEAALIVDIIKRDLPYYDAAISPEFVTSMNAFARDVGILKGDPSYDSVVATQFSALWKP